LFSYCPLFFRPILFLSCGDERQSVPDFFLFSHWSESLTRVDPFYRRGFFLPSPDTPLSSTFSKRPRLVDHKSCRVSFLRVPCRPLLIFSFLVVPGPLLHVTPLPAFFRTPALRLHPYSSFCIADPGRPPISVEVFPGIYFLFAWSGAPFFSFPLSFPVLFSFGQPGTPSCFCGAPRAYPPHSGQIFNHPQTHHVPPQSFPRRRLPSLPRRQSRAPGCAPGVLSFGRPVRGFFVSRF